MGRKREPIKPFIEYTHRGKVRRLPHAGWLADQARALLPPEGAKTHLDSVIRTGATLCGIAYDRRGKMPFHLSRLLSETNCKRCRNYVEMHNMHGYYVKTPETP